METAWLEDFIKLAEEGNFSRAAQARNLSQPAFSRRIKALEEWVDATLIDRDTHRIALTPAGAAFRSVAEELLRRLALGRDEARALGAAQTSTLRFASTHALSVTFFPDWLRGFEDESELGPVSLIADHMAACERIMLEGTADMLLCHHHPSARHRLDEGNFRSVSLGDDQLIPVCVPDSCGTPLFPLPGKDGEFLPYLEFDEHSGMGRILAASQVIERGGAQLRPVFRSHLASVLLRMARDGKGIAWAPMSLCAGDLASGRLMKAAEGWDVPIEIRIFRPRQRRSTAVEAFWRRLPAAE
ncbi:LysR family transcriptional regulator [Gluconacetobacter diazotrophicus]|uniref:LysR family transcriptional regulator n=1 Tax=Gluconacetobacter diazotrophicus TaxID=33996 RepID=A0A7W4I769_GLUDI|nr:LysR family transcriptional regulator [Gluconacetobacter diazotrophicus]